jgi:septal ring factor EnvC (AmiA/AmiB activator)
MTDMEGKLATVDEQIAEGVAQREVLIRRIADLPFHDAEWVEAKRRRDVLNEVLTALRRYRRALESVRGI